MQDRGMQKTEAGHRPEQETLGLMGIRSAFFHNARNAPRGEFPPHMSLSTSSVQIFAASSSEGRPNDTRKTARGQAKRRPGRTTTRDGAPDEASRPAPGSAAMEHAGTRPGYGTPGVAFGRRLARQIARVRCGLAG